MSTRKEFVMKVVNALWGEGDMFFGTGSVKKDYELILSTLRSQGYWAGNRMRYYFNEEADLIRVEERQFGNKS